MQFKNREEFNNWYDQYGHATAAEDLETDNEGQLIIYTDWYVWADGSVHDELEDDDSEDDGG